jgi:hypothetical protein
MDREAIISALAAALERGGDEAREVETQIADVPPRVRDIILLHKLSEPIEKVLLGQDEFQEGGGFVIHRDNGYTGFDASSVAVALLDLARDQGPEPAADWLEKILATDKADGLCVMALWGVTVTEAIELPESIRLVKLSDVPASSQRDWLLESSRLALEAPLLPFSLSGAPPVALFRPISVDPFISDLRRGEPPREKDPLRYQYLLDDARLALTVVGPSAPIQAAYWFQFDDPDLQRAAFYGGLATSHLEIVPLPHNPVALPAATAQWAVERFLKLTDSTSDRTRIALERLNQGIRRAKLGDRAMELAIALEVLLVDDYGENTYKVALRAALLLGGDDAQRIENRAMVSGLYALRSQLVHDGRIQAKVRIRGRGKIASSEVITSGTRICAGVIKEILDRADIPDWYEFELTNPV